jgi:6-phosphogluconolactonase
VTSIAGRMIVAKDADALSAQAVQLIAQRMADCDMPFRMVLSGGITPISVYRRLARAPGLPWPCVELFLGDERFVPLDHQDSNYRMVRETLLLDGTVQPRKFFAMPTDDTPQSAAARYDEMLRQQYGSGTLEAGVPLFHLTLLGLGDDGHTASLLPGQPVLQERQAWAAAVPHGRPEPRLTLTYPALEASALILFLVSGAGKREALAKVRNGALPAGALRPKGEVIWLVDEAAAGG